MGLWEIWRSCGYELQLGAALLVSVSTKAGLQRSGEVDCVWRGMCLWGVWSWMLQREVNAFFGVCNRKSAMFAVADISKKFRREAVEGTRKSVA